MEVRPVFIKGPVGLAPAVGIKAVEVIAPRELEAVAGPAVELDPVNEHINRQDAVVPVAYPGWVVWWPEVKTELGVVRKVTGLIASGSANDLVIHQPAYAVRSPFQSEGVVRVTK